MAELQEISARSRIYAHDTAQGIVVSFAAKLCLYTGDGILIRDLSEEEARTLIDEELMFR